MTVLILAGERDPTADRMVRELARRGAAVLRCDTAWFPDSVDLDARFRDGCWEGRLRVRDRVVDLAALRAVWYRSPGAFAFPAGLSATERHWATTEARLGLGGVLSALPLTWVNHPAHQADATKPLQLAVATRCGLTVADTLITNTPAAVQEFAAERETVAKALGAPSIVEAAGRMTAFTHRLDAADLADLRGVEITLHQFQHWVPKAYEARVIVAGERVFTAGIHAGTPETHLDWRTSYGDLAYSRPALPDHVAAGLRHYCVAFGLAYTAFDFVITPDGEWVFLEGNAGGQFGWIEDAIGAPITAALADLLTQPAPDTADPDTAALPFEQRHPGRAPATREAARAAPSGPVQATTTREDVAMTQLDEVTTGWQARADALAAGVATALSGVNPAWPAAVAAVPRHVLVPQFHEQRADAWVSVQSGDPGWLDAVYRDVALVTALMPGPDGRPEVVSSSTKPALMVRMLDALDIAEGHRVLEIGTGTGYNAALLCHHLGQDAVSSVDIGAQLVDLARARLATLGYRPDLAALDGRRGRPGHGRFDRIIATCSVAEIPRDWHEQLVDDGRLLVDYKVGLHAGSLVLLHRRGDRLEGRFLPKWAGFMAVRDADTAPVSSPHAPGPVRWESHTRVDPDPWAALVPCFLAQIADPPITGFGRCGPDLATTRIGATDGSWAEIDPAGPDGERRVREGGPRRVWAAFEAAHQQWAAWGRPGWDRLGMTVTAAGEHLLWLDTPDATIRGSGGVPTAAVPVARSA